MDFVIDFNFHEEKRPDIGNFLKKGRVFVHIWGNFWKSEKGGLGWVMNRSGGDREEGHEKICTRNEKGVAFGLLHAGIGTRDFLYLGVQGSWRDREQIMKRIRKRSRGIMYPVCTRKKGFALRAS